MSWKTDCVLIRPWSSHVKVPEFLQSLGYQLKGQIGEAEYSDRMWPPGKSVWFGQINDCLIISSRGISERFFKPAPDAFMRQIFQYCPEAEVCALVLHGGVNAWGFSLFGNGQLVRCKRGDADNGTNCEDGEPLSEEEDLLSQSTLEDGERVYRLRDFPNDPMPEDAVGEEFVFKMYQRLTFLRPDHDDQLRTLKTIGFRADNPGDSLLRGFFRALIG